MPTSIFLACDLNECWPEFSFNSINSDISILNGDLINVFPSPGNPLEGSIVYEIAPEQTINALKDFGKYKQGLSKCDLFIEYAKDMFQPDGKYYEEVRKTYKKRIERGFENIKNDKDVLILAGNLDFPDILERQTNKNGFVYLDSEYYYNDISFSGVGGIPSYSNPLEGRFQVFPNETKDEEYFNIFKKTNQSDIVVTHLNFDYFNKNEKLINCFNKNKSKILILGSGDKKENEEIHIDNKKIIIPGSFEYSGGYSFKL